MVKNFFLIITYLLFAVSGLTFIKLGSKDAFNFSIVNGIFKAEISFLSLLGILFYGISFILYMFVIAKFNLSFIYPVISGIVYVLVLIISLSFFKEILTAKQIIGASFVLFGIIFMNLPK